MSRIDSETYLHEAANPSTNVEIKIYYNKVYDRTIYVSPGPGTGRCVKDLQDKYSNIVKRPRRLARRNHSQTEPEDELDHGQMFDAYDCQPGCTEWYNKWVAFYTLTPIEKKELWTAPISKDWYNFEPFDTFAKLVFDNSCQSAVEKTNFELSQQCYEEVLLAWILDQLVSAKIVVDGSILGMKYEVLPGFAPASILEALYIRTDFLQLQSRNTTLKLTPPGYKQVQLANPLASNVIAQLQSDRSDDRFACMSNARNKTILLQMQRQNITLPYEYCSLTSMSMTTAFITNKKQQIVSTDECAGLTFLHTTKDAVDKAWTMMKNPSKNRKQDFQIFKHCSELGDYVAVFAMFPFLFDGDHDTHQFLLPLSKHVTVLNLTSDCMLELETQSNKVVVTSGGTANHQAINRPSIALQESIKTIANDADTNKNVREKLKTDSVAIVHLCPSDHVSSQVYKNRFTKQCDKARRPQQSESSFGAKSIFKSLRKLWTS